MRVVWTRRALDDLDAIGRYIAGDSPGAAHRWILCLVNRADTLADFPGRGRVVPEYSDPGVREIIVGNYRVVYRVRVQKVEILTVFDGRKLLNVE